MTTPADNNFSWDNNRQILDVVGRLLMGGIVGPFFSPANAGIIYYDLTSQRFKASENGGAPVNLLTGGGGGSAYTNVQVNGTPQAQEDTLNLVGNAFSGSDVPGVKTNVTLSQSPVGSTSVVGTGRLINTTAPIAGGGDLSADRTLSMHVADATHDGYLSQTDWSNFNTAFTSGVPNTRNINTTAPLTGGGNLSSDRTLGITQSGVATDGYLSSVDWNTFNNKVSATRAINTGTGLTGGGNLSADRTLSVVPNTTNQQVRVDKNGTFVGQRKEVNLIEGTNVTMTVADNPGSDRVDVTINSTGGGGGTDISVRVRNSGNQSIPNTTFTPIQFNTEIFDTDNMHDNVTNNTRLTCNTAGKFLIHGLVDMNLPVNCTVALQILLNGSTILAQVQHFVGNLTLDDVLEVSTLINLSPGDFVELSVFQNGGGAFNSVANSPWAPVFEAVRQPG